MKPGTLYLVPAPLDFACTEQVPLQTSMPEQTLVRTASLTSWISENARSTRAYLKRVGQLHPLSRPMQEIEIQELPREVHKHGDHDGRFDARDLLRPATTGQDMGLICEAGMPGIADPGSSVVRAAHTLQIPVQVLVGPVSLMLALAASGLNGQHFAFAGYLPQEASERSRRIVQLESLALKSGQTQLFIETPYRNQALFAALVSTLQDRTWLSVACGLTLPGGWSLCLQRQGWKTRPVPDLTAPTVFAIGR
jgi:16S rRNA (cytidine1402-2'-O)-methyltransferase